MLDTQGTSGAGTRFAAMAWALVRRQKLNGAMATAAVETEERSGGKRRRLGLNRAAQKHKEATQETSPRQREAEDVHARAWKRTEGRRRCSYGGEHCSQYLQVCHSPKFTNYSQIFITTQKSPKIKVVQNQKFYNFAFITIS